jgi:hypothetical protein
MSSEHYAVIFPVTHNVSKRFTDEQIETAALVMFWTHPPEGFMVVEDPEVEWGDDFMRDRRWVRAIGKLVSCN